MKTKRVPVTNEDKITVLTRIVDLIKRCVGFGTGKHRALEAENFFFAGACFSRSSIGVSKICILTSATIHIFDYTFKTKCTQNGQSSFEFQIKVTNWCPIIFFLNSHNLQKDIHNLGTKFRLGKQ
jgi:hypothetical protein